MKKLLLFSTVLFLFSCLGDENSFEEESIQIEESFEKSDAKKCPLRIISTGTDEKGCCTYNVYYTPGKRTRGYFTLQSGGININGVITQKGTYLWKIRVCPGEEIEVCLYSNNAQNGTSQLVCCKTVSCNKEVTDCNIDVSIEDLGTDEYGDCTYEICVRNSDPRIGGCGYSLFIDGVEQGSPLRCCWIITVDSGETVLIEIFNSNGDLCYQEELTCEESCCSNLGYEVCYFEPGELDCWQFEIKLTPSYCTDVDSVAITDKKGDARLLFTDGNVARFEACITNETPAGQQNVGVNAHFYTEECGTFTTGFFYPLEDYKNGVIGDCGFN